jgi:hypothetical protein
MFGNFDVRYFRRSVLQRSIIQCLGIQHLVIQHLVIRCLLTVLRYIFRCPAQHGKKIYGKRASDIMVFYHRDKYTLYAYYLGGGKGAASELRY